MVPAVTVVIVVAAVATAVVGVLEAVAAARPVVTRAIAGRILAEDRFLFAARSGVTDLQRNPTQPDDGEEQHLQQRVHGEFP